MDEPFDSYSLIIETDETNALILGEALADWNLGVHLPDGAGTATVAGATTVAGVATLEIFCATHAEAKSRWRALQALAPQAHFGAATIKPVARQDWAESWKRFFHTQRVSERIVVKPSWESVAARPEDCIVEIDPGLSFGTGLHGTTRACLQFLDNWQRRQPQASVLDMGCGTGILAIAAAKLGFPRVTAMDNDPAAVRVARANAACNEVADRIECIQADVAIANVAIATVAIATSAEFKADTAYDLVLANLLAGILIQCADRIAAAVRRAPGSGLVLSGILEEQYDAVRSAYLSRGFEEQESIVMEGWKTGCFCRCSYKTN
ncbi:MAG: 50S ribosomal protein L11 methyltransferase [Verrucomicrobia bacterium]|nr:50S ribosomal protein L11 methyltransferase [Verrucomicrobiota bacterium]MBU1734405.1 50S ribosomal protein L11 methyltransferase [Verrucomicrobiota bacterium]MBU1855693.1 50S ribosomal protein L11 methyltransferase [Verrucomicrobiota bacterium]